MANYSLLASLTSIFTNDEDKMKTKIAPVPGNMMTKIALMPIISIIIIFHHHPFLKLLLVLLPIIASIDNHP